MEGADTTSADPYITPYITPVLPQVRRYGISLSSTGAVEGADTTSADDSGVNGDLRTDGTQSGAGRHRFWGHFESLIYQLVPGLKLVPPCAIRIC